MSGFPRLQIENAFLASPPKKGPSQSRKIGQEESVRSFCGGSGLDVLVWCYGFGDFRGDVLGYGGGYDAAGDGAARDGADVAVGLRSGIMRAELKASRVSGATLAVAR